MTSIIRPQLLCPLLRISLSQGKKKNLLSAEIVSTAGEPSKPELTSATAVARHGNPVVIRFSSLLHLVDSSRLYSRISMVSLCFFPSSVPEFFSQQFSMAI